MALIARARDIDNARAGMEDVVERFSYFIEDANQAMSGLVSKYDPPGNMDIEAIVEEVKSDLSNLVDIIQRPMPHNYDGKKARINISITNGEYTGLNMETNPWRPNFPSSFFSHPFLHFLFPKRKSTSNPPVGCTTASARRFSGEGITKRRQAAVKPRWQRWLHFAATEARRSAPTSPPPAQSIGKGDDNHNTTAQNDQVPAESNPRPHHKPLPEALRRLSCRFAVADFLPICTPPQTIPTPQLLAARSPQETSDPKLPVACDPRTISTSSPNLVNPVADQGNLKRLREVTRCSESSCRKKVRLMGFRCRCGEMLLLVVVVSYLAAH
ncbi:hypothetical protein PHJA_001643800 [Phtheirospermum japonicum]|uniref:Uncharacterized protein n=1 Tax=Phtheirospermum japonicum TaxID=374723 RepID=A0A830CF78_9LAMI|nr:hypothetical protein PHJA_001643800 [Phtheirospermum japonicum]